MEIQSTPTMQTSARSSISACLPDPCVISVRKQWIKSKYLPPCRTTGFSVRIPNEPLLGTVVAYFSSRLTVEMLITGVQVTVTSLITYFLCGFMLRYGLFWSALYCETSYCRVRSAWWWWCASPPCFSSKDTLSKQCHCSERDIYHDVGACQTVRWTAFEQVIPYSRQRASHTWDDLS